MSTLGFASWALLKVDSLWSHSHYLPQGEGLPIKSLATAITKFLVSFSQVADSQIIAFFAVFAPFS